jgi:eukaryotic-like serine/threonine-protein kinase
VLAGTVLQNTYVLADRLGAGGMGEVYVASHTRLRKRFAVKLLAPGHAPEGEAFMRFRREAEITSRLGHPNIVEVVDFNETEDGRPFLVMELLEGEDLAARLARGPLDTDAALRIADQIASALHAAHAEQVVHRDLKPQNVYLARRGRDEAWVKILDFGISKIRGAAGGVTHSRVVIGTPGYMAPEQAEGRIREVDAHSDQFALAVIVYEMLAGKPPFVGESIPSTLYQIVHHEPPRLDAVRPGVPAHVVAAVARGMAKRPDDRFVDVATFAAALRGEVPPDVGTAVTELTAGAATPRLVVRAGSDTASADTVASAGTVATGDLTMRDRPRRVRPAWWGIGGGLVLAAAAVVLALAAGGRRDREPAAPAPAPAPLPGAGSGGAPAPIAGDEGVPTAPRAAGAPTAPADDGAPTAPHAAGAPTAPADAAPVAAPGPADPARPIRRGKKRAASRAAPGASREPSPPPPELAPAKPRPPPREADFITEF